MAVLVVDTNVLVAASGASNCSKDCFKRALEFVEYLGQNQDVLAVDHAYLILGEYQDNLSLNVYPQSIGAELFKRLHDMGRFYYQQIELDDHKQPILHKDCQVHDKSDWKFIAVSLAHSNKPNIYNATDSDWREDFLITQKCGVKIIELCESN